MTLKKNMPSKGITKKLLRIFVVTLGLGALLGMNVLATGVSIDFSTENADGAFGSLELLFMFILLAVAPSLLVMMTSFTRIIIVFSFLRTALGLQTTPPNQVLIGLALFLSLFIMQPTIMEINEVALEPYYAGEIDETEFLELAQDPLKEFMLKETDTDDLNLFLSLSGSNEMIQEESTDALLEIGLEVITPAFITSELKYAFTVGFLLFLPFLIIDMIVASTLMSMGMVMLPPSMISLPFKIMLFVVVDGWSLLMETLIRSFL